ncbi:MAG: hypothetical protein M0R00_02890 [Candidatus Omnitrophica bacterium]|jgi:hypothetical protein|nr:hypothetical protein [Candidatus Omnitrophota bacterium]
MYKNHVLKALAKKQADGAQTLGNKGYEYLAHHQITIEVSAQPSAGTLAVQYLPPGGSEYVTVTGSPVDLTTLNKSKTFRLDNVYVEAFKFTPSSLDTEKTYNIIVASNEQ